MPSQRAEGWKRKQSTAHHGERAGRMLLPQLGKLPGRGSLSSHSPGRKPLWEDSGSVGLSPKPFNKETISRSCCTPPLPEPRSLSRPPVAAIMPWTCSAPPSRALDLKSQSPSASPALCGKPQGSPTGSKACLFPSRRDKGAVQVLELGHCHRLPSSSQAARPMVLVPTPHPWGAHPPFCSCPRSSKSPA